LICLALASVVGAFVLADAYYLHPALERRRVLDAFVNAIGACKQYDSERSSVDTDLDLLHTSAEGGEVLVPDEADFRLSSRVLEAAMDSGETDDMSRWDHSQCIRRELRSAGLTPTQLEVMKPCFAHLYQAENDPVRGDDAPWRPKFLEKFAECTTTMQVIHSAAKSEKSTTP